MSRRCANARATRRMAHERWRKYDTVRLRFLSIRRIVLLDQASWRGFSSITNFESMWGSFRKYSKYWCWRLINDGGVRVQYKAQYKTASIFVATHSLNSYIIFGIYIHTASTYTIVTLELMDGRCCLQERLVLCWHPLWMHPGTCRVGAAVFGKCHHYMWQYCDNRQPHCATDATVVQ